MGCRPTRDNQAHRHRIVVQIRWNSVSAVTDTAMGSRDTRTPLGPDIPARTWEYRTRSGRRRQLDRTRLGGKYRFSAASPPSSVQVNADAPRRRTDGALQPTSHRAENSGTRRRPIAKAAMPPIAAPTKIRALPAPRSAAVHHPCGQFAAARYAPPTAPAAVFINPVLTDPAMG